MTADSADDIALPFVYCRQPQERSTLDDITAWAGRLGLDGMRATRQALATSRVGDFSSFAYPFSGFDERSLADRWVLWTLIIDELFEECIAAGRLGQAPSASDDPRHALLRVDAVALPRRHLAALDDLLAQTLDGMPQAWQAEFLRDVAVFIRSGHTEAANRVNGEGAAPPDFESFVRLRRGSFATGLFISLIQKVTGSGAPAAPEAAGLCGQLRDCAADLGGWCNDLLSYRRELGKEDDNNIVLLAAKVNGWPVDQAVRWTRSMVHDRAWEFIALKARLPALLHKLAVDDAAASRAFQWVQDLELLVSGSLTFQLTSLRWQAPQAGRPAAGKAHR